MNLFDDRGIVASYNPVQVNPPNAGPKSACTNSAVVS